MQPSQPSARCSTRRGSCAGDKRQQAHKNTKPRNHETTKTRDTRARRFCFVVSWISWFVVEDREGLVAIRTFGSMGVDWEQRIDFDRLRRERLAGVKGLGEKSGIGALPCFHMNKVRHITATHLGTWAEAKIRRVTLLPPAGQPDLG